jgi:hypothetical protein
VECDLSRPVSDWMASMGYTPYAEVPFPQSNHPIDLVGRNGREIITVELKVSLTKKLIHQAYICDLITDKRYAAVGTKPKAKGIEECKRHGIGLLSVIAGKVNVIVEHREKNPDTTWVRRTYAESMHRNLDVMTPNGLGGVPCMKGIGPAQECFDRVCAYRIKHPKAKWREIFNAVHNHYESSNSMCGAMRVVMRQRAKLARETGTSTSPK